MDQRIEYLAGEPVEYIVKELNDMWLFVRPYLRARPPSGSTPNSEWHRRRVQLLNRVHQAGMMSKLNPKFLELIVSHHFFVEKADGELVKSILSRLRSSRDVPFQSFLVIRDMLQFVADEDTRPGFPCSKDDPWQKDASRSDTHYLTFNLFLAVEIDHEIRAGYRPRIAAEEFDYAMQRTKTIVSQYWNEVYPLISEWSRFSEMSPEYQAIIRTLLLVRNDARTVLAPIPNELIKLILSFFDTPEEEMRRERIQARRRVTDHVESGTIRLDWPKPKDYWTEMCHLALVILAICFLTAFS